MLATSRGNQLLMYIYCYSISLTNACGKYPKKKKFPEKKIEMHLVGFEPGTLSIESQRANS